MNNQNNKSNKAADIMILAFLLLIPAGIFMLSYKQFSNDTKVNNNNKFNIFNKEEKPSNSNNGYTYNNNVNNENSSNQTPSNNQPQTNREPQTNNQTSTTKPTTSTAPKATTSTTQKPTTSTTPKTTTTTTPRQTPITVAVSSVTMSAKTQSITVGGTASLTASVSPSNATIKTITWTSSNTKVATVTNGKVKGVSAGTATITAKSNNGKTATCTVTVKNATTSTTVAVTSVSLSEMARTVYINNPSSAFSVTATVSPSNATNKTVTWTSSDTNVATVSNGTVTPKNPGVATITAKSGTVQTSMTLTVKKKVIIELGASQSYRFIKYNVNSYTRGANQYSTTNGTLVHIAKSGCEMSWQYSGDGLTQTKQTIESYASKKQYVEFYLYYLLIGNTIKDSSCSTINNNSSVYTTPLNGYNNATNYFKNNGYNVNTYVVSMHPVKPGESNAGKFVVENKNDNYCSTDYRSNWKYNLYNNKVKNAIASSYSQLHYVDTFNQIMNTSGATSSNRAYTYKISYVCEGDGVHWNDPTAHTYLKLMLDTNNPNL